LAYTSRFHLSCCSTDALESWGSGCQCLRFGIFSDTLGLEDYLNCVLQEWREDKLQIGFYYLRNA